MANEKNKNKNSYTPLKNPELIGQGKKETVQQTLDKGPQGKRENETHLENEKRKEQAANKPKLYQEAIRREKQSTVEPSKEVGKQKTDIDKEK